MQTIHLFVLIHSRNKDGGTVTMFMPSRNVLTNHPKAPPFLLIRFDICGLCLSVILSCLFLAALWSPAKGRADFLALLYVMFSCVFDTFQNGVLAQVWYLIVSIPDLCIGPNLHVPYIRKIINKMHTLTYTAGQEIYNLV